MDILRKWLEFFYASTNRMIPELAKQLPDLEVAKLLVTSFPCCFVSEHVHTVRYLSPHLCLLPGTWLEQMPVFSIRCDETEHLLMATICCTRVCQILGWQRHKKTKILIFYDMSDHFKIWFSKMIISHSTSYVMHSVSTEMIYTTSYGSLTKYWHSYYMHHNPLDLPVFCCLRSCDIKDVCMWYCYIIMADNQCR